MNKIKTYTIVMFLIAILAMMPLCFAAESKDSGVVLAGDNPGRKGAKFLPVFVGLSAWVADMLIAAGVVSIAVGSAAMVYDYVVYHSSSNGWIYFEVGGYSSMTDHAYNHINDFPNIWGSRGPSRSDFKRKCKNTINSDSSSIRRFEQVKGASREIGRYAAYDAASEMLVIGETDGRTIVSCERRPLRDIEKKIRDGIFKEIRKVK